MQQLHATLQVQQSSTHRWQSSIHAKAPDVSRTFMGHKNAEWQASIMLQA
jgi:hypothetical protein